MITRSSIHQARFRKVVARAVVLQLHNTVLYALAPKSSAQSPWLLPHFERSFAHLGNIIDPCCVGLKKTSHYSKTP